LGLSWKKNALDEGATAVAVAAAPSAADKRAGKAAIIEKATAKPRFKRGF